MQKTNYIFANSTVCCYVDVLFKDLLVLTKIENVIIITDENVYKHHKEKLDAFPVIKFPAGEDFKNQSTVDEIIEKLIKLEAHKNSFLLGIGGGVVTDIVGYVAAIYMRGIQFGLVPTSILAMVDASIGGKNGIDVGVYKNMIGTIKQPKFIFYDYVFLDTLPVKEWVNGFAEIIKHACIKDALLFSILERYNLHDYQTDSTLIAELIERNINIKFDIVTQDELEKGDRKLLNFGHTIGHAIENLHHLPHGHAVSIGIVAACNLSVRANNFHVSEASKIVNLLARYQLPVIIETDYEKVFSILKMDKKRREDVIHFILLNKIGDAVIMPVPLEELEKHFKEIL